MSGESFDFIVIGGGIAGFSVAAELSRSARVAVLERESRPGYHATGRSAALYSELYGNATIRALTRASRSFFFDPPDGFSANPLVSPRGTLYFAEASGLDALDAFARTFAPGEAPERLDAAQTLALVSAFRPGYLGGALYEAGSADIDVDAVLQGFAAQCRQHGVRIETDSPVESLLRGGDRWRVRTTRETFVAPVIVNAAGAWGDEVASLAGAAPVGLVPKRRTVVLVDLPADERARRWPAAVHVEETFYFKPDAGQLLLSPADETPSAPCDAQPDEYDIAVAVDRFEQATGQPVRKLRSRWAGLRSFVADKTPVVGFDPVVPGFFWLVGQGGYGIQTAPTMARAAAALARGDGLPRDVLDEGVTIDVLAASPVRFGGAR